MSIFTVGKAVLVSALLTLVTLPLAAALVVAWSLR